MLVHIVKTDAATASFAKNGIWQSLALTSSSHDFGQQKLTISTRLICCQRRRRPLYK